MNSIGIVCFINIGYNGWRLAVGGRPGDFILILAGTRANLRKQSKSLGQKLNWSRSVGTTADSDLQPTYLLMQLSGCKPAIFFFAVDSVTSVISIRVVISPTSHYWTF